MINLKVIVASPGMGRLSCCRHSLDHGAFLVGFGMASALRPLHEREEVACQSGVGTLLGAQVDGTSSCRSLHLPRTQCWQMQNEKLRLHCWLLTFMVLNPRDYELLLQGIPESICTCGFPQSVYIKTTTNLIRGLDIFTLDIGKHWTPFGSPHNCYPPSEHLSTDIAIINSLHCPGKDNECVQELTALSVRWKMKCHQWAEYLPYNIK